MIASVECENKSVQGKVTSSDNAVLLSKVAKVLACSLSIEIRVSDTKTYRTNTCFVLHLVHMS